MKIMYQASLEIETIYKLGNEGEITGLTNEITCLDLE
jgi:hypothetical protein